MNSKKLKIMVSQMVLKKRLTQGESITTAAKKTGLSSIAFGKVETAQSNLDIETLAKVMEYARPGSTRVLEYLLIGEEWKINEIFGAEETQGDEKSKPDQTV